ncbi:MAG: response regulator transcription factor [Actinomycetia bacterium]|nr:response regulator transcription factor [Actinomycetes bacterium]
MSAIRVLLADDHPVLRAGLSALLSAEPEIEVVGEADDGLDCMELAAKLRPDIILLDINMPRCGGFEALDRIRDELPDTRVLVLTMHDDVGYLRRVLAAGGSGYILKQAAGAELLTALHTVSDGGVFIHPHHAQLLATDARTSVPADSVDDAANGDERRYRSLSDREAEVFRLVALGHSNGEIADMMFLSVKTIETYKSRLMKKLGVDSRAALVRLALELDVLK